MCAANLVWSPVSQYSPSSWDLKIRKDRLKLAKQANDLDMDVWAGELGLHKVPHEPVGSKPDVDWFAHRVCVDNDAGQRASIRSLLSGGDAWHRSLGYARLPDLPIVITRHRTCRCEHFRNRCPIFRLSLVTHRDAGP